MRHHRSRRLGPALALALLLTLGACGSGESASPAASSGARNKPLTTTTAATPETDATDTAPQPATSPTSSRKTESAASPVAPNKTVAARSNASALPDIEVLHVPSDAPVRLRSQLVADQPTVLWFWAPHCPFCVREAPKMKAFAAKHGDRIRVIGLGAQDSRSQARDFVQDTDTGGLPMLWDESGESWIKFNVTNQPTVIVLSSDGEQRARFFRDFDEDAILKAAGLSY